MQKLDLQLLQEKKEKEETHMGKISIWNCLKIEFEIVKLADLISWILWILWLRIKIG